MSPRLLFLNNTRHAIATDRDRADAQRAAARYLRPHVD
jgi:hypothetical protein